jgi:hypothetical protein
MSTTVKIKISESAYVRLLEILEEVKEYSHVRFSYKDGCCGSNKIELYLDNANPDDTICIIDELPIAYNNEVSENIKEITLVYREGALLIKAEPIKPLYKNCSTCTKGCGNHKSDSTDCNNNCTGKNCSGCSKV